MYIMWIKLLKHIFSWVKQFFSWVPGGKSSVTGPFLESPSLQVCGSQGQQCLCGGGTQLGRNGTWRLKPGRVYGNFNGNIMGI